ncbi:MAG: hypothetical protein QW303_06665, partial [Nitrososphaerota archaeon]
MERFLKYLTKAHTANVTYLAIGAAYLTKDETQQHPPFLDMIMNHCFNLSFQVIIIDPNTENPPEIANYYKIEEFKLPNDNQDVPNYLVYRKKNLTINVINEEFDFRNFEKANNKSRELLFALIDKVVDAKEKNKKDTYLLFVHDFSGNQIIDLAYYVDEALHEKLEYKKWSHMKYDLYRRIVQIDLSHRKGEGCNPNMKPKYFRPFLVAKDNALEIFNPFNAADHELVSALYCDDLVRETTIRSIKYRFEKFRSVVINKYIETCKLLPLIEVEQDQSLPLIEVGKECIDKFVADLDRVTSFLNFFIFKEDDNVPKSLNEFRKVCKC